MDTFCLVAFQLVWLEIGQTKNLDVFFFLLCYLFHFFREFVGPSKPVSRRKVAGRLCGPFEDPGWTIVARRCATSSIRCWGSISWAPFGRWSACARRCGNGPLGGNKSPINAYSLNRFLFCPCGIMNDIQRASSLTGRKAHQMLTRVTGLAILGLASFHHPGDCGLCLYSPGTGRWVEGSPILTRGMADA